jgi:hypothetical protein
MAEEQEMCPAILKALKVSQRGLTVTDISRKIRHNRNSTAQQLEILRAEGKVAVEEILRSTGLCPSPRGLPRNLRPDAGMSESFFSRIVRWRTWITCHAILTESQNLFQNLIRRRYFIKFPE